MKSKKITPSYSDGMFKAVWETAYDGMVLVNEAGIIVSCNPVACKIFGYNEDELVDRLVDILIPLSVRGGHKQLVDHFFHGGESKIMGGGREISGCRKNGKMVSLEIGLNKFTYKGEKLVLAALRDISERKKLDKKLTRLAYFDQLTGLANRRYFEKHIQNRLLSARRYGEKFSIIYMDLNKFKQVNDTLGHKAGDAVLKYSAQRIKSALRASDLLARLGGDEFVSIIGETKTAPECEIVAERIIKSFRQPIEVRNNKLSIGISLGIAMYPVHGEEEDLLIKNADNAMYKAKRSGGMAYSFYK